MHRQCNVTNHIHEVEVSKIKALSYTVLHRCNAFRSFSRSLLFVCCMLKIRFLVWWCCCCTDFRRHCALFGFFYFFILPSSRIRRSAFPFSSYMCVSALIVSFKLTDVFARQTSAQVWWNAFMCSLLLLLLFLLMLFEFFLYLPISELYNHNIYHTLVDLLPSLILEWCRRRRDSRRGWRNRFIHIEQYINRCTITEAKTLRCG